MKYPEILIDSMKLPGIPRHQKSTMCHAGLHQHHLGALHLRASNHLKSHRLLQAFELLSHHS